jgi:hypothetical protein
MRDNEIVPTHSSTGKDHDFATVAKRVVEQAIGEQWDRSPLPDKDKGKNPAAGRARRCEGRGGTGGGAITRQARGDCKESGRGALGER